MSAKLTGWYRDPLGMNWFCVERASQVHAGTTVVCHSDDGFMTAAPSEVFRTWGWKRTGADPEDAGAQP